MRVVRSITRLRARRVGGGAALAIALLATLAAAAGPKPGSELAGTVVKIRDGDSMAFRRDGTTTDVRVFGVDSPERAQPYSARAKSFTAELVGNREVVVVVRDVDRYGRIVGDVKLPDGRDLGRELVRAGLAWVYRRYTSNPELIALEADARAARRGLWSDPRPVPPWKFRAARRGR